MPQITNEQRAARVAEAIARLQEVLEEAEAATARHGHGTPEAHAAWEKVEEQGATVHRNGRLLAGKRKGG